MPVLFVNMKKHNSTEREPYSSFAKRFDSVKDNLHGERIELCAGSGKRGAFNNGFYNDEDYFKNAMLTFDFAEIDNGTDISPRSTFVRMTLSYECSTYCDIEYQLQRIKALKLRVPYFYIPDVTHLEFSSPIDEDVKLQFDVLVPDKEKILNVCCSLINQVIAVFSLDD